VLLALAIPGAITHCSSSDAAGGGPESTSSSGTTMGIGVTTLPPGGAGGDASEPEGLYNPLCGGYDTHDCNPDDEEACRGVEVDGDSNTHGSGGSAATGVGGSSSTGLAGQAGAPSEAGAGGEAGEGGADGSDGIPVDEGPDVSIMSDTDPLTPSGVACQVSPSEDGPTRVCALSGGGRESDPCTSATDCAAGFACIGEGEAGICRPYCCSVGQDPCASGDYCGERTLWGSELTVPVCVRADNCSLSQEFPCQNEEECQCQEGTACLVVRSDGTTTCAAPGEGEAGDACPCAWGHVCSQASGTCLKLCETVVDSDQCDGGICQVAPNLPDSWGVCINTDARQ
jgi:hypothetical protein